MNTKNVTVAANQQPMKLHLCAHNLCPVLEIPNTKNRTQLIVVLLFGVGIGFGLCYAYARQ